MEIIHNHDHNQEKTKLITLGIAEESFCDLSFHVINDDEEENRKNLKRLFRIFYRKYVILDRGGDELVSYHDNWDLHCFHDNNFTRMTFSVNEKNTPAQNMKMLQKILKTLRTREIDTDDIVCRIDYATVVNHSKAEKEAMKIIKGNLEKFINYYGNCGKFRKLKDSDEKGVEGYGFFPKGTKIRYCPLEAEDIVLNFLA